MSDPRDMGKTPPGADSHLGLEGLDGDEEATVMREIPEDLLDEATNASPPREAPTGGSIFSNNAAPIRGALPTEEEGDALLDQLLSDPALTPPPATPAPSRSTPPPLPSSSEPQPLVSPGLFADVGDVGDDESVDEPTRMLSALSFEEQERVVLDLAGRKIAGEERDEDAADVDVGGGELDLAPAAEEAPIDAPDSDARETADNDVAFTSVAPPAEEEPIDEESTVQHGAAPAPSEAPPAAEPAEAPAPAKPSIRPIAIASRPPPAEEFSDEQDAAAHLLQTQQRDAWVARAEWLRAEAEAMEDKGNRARSMLAVSELFAMAGEEATAKGIAEQTRDLSPTMALAHQQVRALVSREADFRAVLDTLDGEARAVHIPAVRAHTTSLGAEVARLRLGDPDAASKRIELSIRAQASDPRGHVQRLCEALAAPEPEAGAPSPLANVRFPDAPQLVALAAAAEQIAVHRSTGAAARASKADAKTPYETLLRTRAALAGDDLSGALAGLSKLGESSSLAGGAGWLAAVLAAPRKETRAEVASSLRNVASGSHGDLARRAVAAHGIETGDAQAAAWAQDDGGSGAFSAADRLVLASLVTAQDGAVPDVGPWIGPVLQNADTAPIAAAASAALTSFEAAERSVETIGEGRARAGAALGRALSQVLSHEGTLRSHPFAEALSAFSDEANGSGAAVALSIEIDADAGNGGRVARAFSEWRADDSAAERDRALAASVLAEIAGEPDRAVLDLDRARDADPLHEGAVRARASHSEASDFARILATHADAVTGPHAAVLLTEAATRLAESDADPAEVARLLEKAISQNPRLPIPLYLAERAARASENTESVAEILRARRDASTDPVEQAHDLVREAMLIAPTDPGGAAALLEQALRARPKDAGLRDLFERLSPEPPPDRAKWRLARAAESSGPETARLALEAAFEHERARDLERAAAAARTAMVTRDVPQPASAEGEEAPPPPPAPLGDELLAAIVAYRAALAGHGAGDLVDALLPQARASTDATERLEIYERLAELDERGRSDTTSALLWRRTILEETPSHLPTLRRVASDLITAGRHEELEPIALETARALTGGESVAHAMLCARLRLAAQTWEATREPVDIAYKHEPRGPWALRQMAAHARAKGEHALAIEADRQLIERTDRASEAATLSLRAAESATAAGDLDTAKALLLAAVELMPEHLVAHLTLARVAEQAGDLAGSAAALEAAASASTTDEEKARNLYRAATLWQDKANEPARARAALEAVASIDPAYEDVFQRLQAIYIAEGARQELASLLEARLARVTDPNERVELEVLRGRALADVGDPAAAKRALAAALDASPDHVEALSAFADVCAAEEDWVGAEQAWIRLARLASEPAQQIAIYNKLGELYDDKLPNPERAELSYEEILKREPGNEAAREKLVALYKRQGDTAKALEQQTVLINNAEAPEAKCKRTTELASIYEAMGDTKKAEATLLGARKTYPKDDVALVALAGFYQRTNQPQAATVLLDRAVTDARRALGAGRFEPYLFSSLATVAEIRGKTDAARSAKVAVASLEGDEALLEGIGGVAGDPALDDILAPEVMTPAFRELLLRTGPVLDTAVPFDLGAIRATPLPPQQQDIAEEVESLAGLYGFPEVRVLTSAALGAVCVPATAHPPTIVLGQALVASPRAEVRTFLIHRALKVLQINAGAFARTAPIDLWPLLAAFLRAYSPSFAPQGVDAGKLNDFYGRVTRAMGGKPDPQLGILAADVIGTIGNRASTLGTAVNGWGNRTGFLAVGDANAALAGIAWSSGNTNAPPASGKDRLTWIGRNAEARELMVFIVSDAFAAARSKAGVGD